MKKNIVSRRSVSLVLGLMVLSMIGLMLPAATVASAKQAPPPSGPKLYSVAVAAEDNFNGTFTFTVTITNLPSSSAVMGSANITVPAGFTGVTLGTLTTSANKNWSKAKTGPASGPTTIKLRAVGDMQKLNPGQFVSIQFTATPPSTSGSYTFGTVAKASRDFSGSSVFTNAGADSILVVCPDAPAPCVGTLGNTSNATPDHQTGSVSLDDGCTGCILTITETPGNFCSEGTLPANCQSPFVVQFDISGSYGGIATVTVACDVSDCPVIVPPPCTECTFSLTNPDFYPLYFTDSDSNNIYTSVTKIDQECSPGFYPVGPPCIYSQGRIGGSNDYFTTVKLQMSIGDPRTGH